MNLGDLIAAYRDLASDDAQPPLWSDTELTRYANEAERDAVERGFLLEDDDGAGSATVATTVQGNTGVTSEVQTIAISAAGGTFTVTYDGQTTAALAYNISAADLQTALIGLSNLSPGDVTVTGGYTLTFNSALGNVSQVTVNGALLLNGLCALDVTANTAVYALDRRVLRIERAQLDSQQHLLFPSAKSILDRSTPDWPRITGIPHSYIDHEATVRLVWVPANDDILRLTVKRLPLADMDSPDDEPEIRPERHYALLYGMLARGYMKLDSQTYNPAQALEYEARFTQHFGAKIDASVRLKQRSARSHVTRINW